MSFCRRLPQTAFASLDRRAPTLPRSALRLPPRVSTGRCCMSTIQPYPIGSTGYRVSTLFTVLMITALAGTSYGLYTFYTTVTTFPQPLRSDLRSAIKTRDTNPKLSAQYFRRAWEAAREMDTSELGSSWPKKLSGIAIALAEVLEKNGQSKESFEVLETAWRDLEKPSETTPEMKLRRVAIASKMSDLAEGWDIALEEKWAEWAIRELVEGPQTKLTVGAPDGLRNLPNTVQEGADPDLKLPAWANRGDYREEKLSCIQKLGGVYARQGKTHDAMGLFLLALRLLPLEVSATTPERQATPTSLCQAAVVFNNISHLLSSKATPGNQEMTQALAWGHRGIQALQQASKMGIDNSEDPDSCRRTAVAAQTSQATLLEMIGDMKSARVLFASAGKLAMEIGWQEGIQEASEGLRRVSRKVSPKPAPPA